MTKSFFTIVILFYSYISQSQTKGFTPTNTNTPERRFALVIGNKDYTSIGALKNPINDALDVSKAFQQLGFEVTTITNADYKKMLNVFNVFTKNLQKNDVVVFYYSGHGISYDGKNFLIPTDASITCLEEVEENALTLGRLMTSVEAKNVKNSFVFLDACRNLPNLKQCNATKRDVAISKGLVRPTNNPSGSMTVYATREGDTADDNSTDRNGLFTSEFLKYINLPNLGLRQILDRTKKGVETRSNKRQSPARYDELSDDFVFVLSSETQISNTVPPQPQPQNPQIQPQPVSNTQPQNGEVKDLPFGPAMVFVKGGSFDMGSNQGEDDAKSNEMVNGKKHRVSVNDFWMAQTEITVEQYLAFCDETNNNFPVWLEVGNNFNIETGSDKGFLEAGYSREAENLPISGVSWDNAVAYCKWLSKKTGLHYRLPTESEWEYAARGGTESNGFTYAGSNNLDEVGWIKSNSKNKPQKVKQKKTNESGLYDMTGNVWEWCQDWGEPYNGIPDPNARRFSWRVFRGGGYDGIPQFIRVASRNGSSPDMRGSAIGFRVVLSE